MLKMGDLFVKRNSNYLNVKFLLFIGISVCFIGAIFSFSPPPYHVSYTEISYKKESKQLTFSIEVFTDDLETAIKLEYKPEKFFLGGKDLSDSTELYIQSYINNKVTVIMDGMVLKQRSYLPTESNPDRTTIYFEYVDIPPFTSLAFYSEVLINLFKDQQNIVEFQANGEKKKALLTIEKTNVTWTNN
jgi:hypothetical protein